MSTAPCDHCGGRGFLPVVLAPAPGVAISGQQRCDRCGGAGQMPDPAPELQPDHDDRYLTVARDDLTRLIAAVLRGGTRTPEDEAAFHRIADALDNGRQDGGWGGS